MKKARNSFLRTGVFVFACAFLYHTQSFFQDSEIGQRNRKLLQVDEVDSNNATKTDPPESGEDPLFPTDLFTKQQLENGAVVLHMIGIIYMFYALALVCDEFFVPSLDIISERLGISPDVAGATFMAAGGSAPELFTSIIGVLIAKNDVGIGTIIGSAVFNILFVIAACAFAAKEALSLTAWPLIRDVFFYSLSLTLLVIFFLDNRIFWYESLILFIIYIAYVSFMAINEKVEDALRSLFRLSKVERDSKEKGIVLRKAQNRKGLYHLMNETINRDILEKKRHHHDMTGEKGEEMVPMNKSGIMIMSNQAGSETGISLSGTGSTGNMDSVATTGISQLKNQLQNSKGDSSPSYPDLADLEKSGNTTDKPVPKVYFFDKNKPNEVSNMSQGLSREASASAEDDDDDDKPIDMSFPKDQGWKKILVYLISLPIMGPLFLTLPDTKHPKKKKFFFITFTLSIIWIALYSYLMVWWATVAGDVIGIPPPVMGLTFLAAGTSVPDLITSVLVAKQGKGDMAVSSSVGSNIFDVTVGLPIPWLLYSIINLAPVDVNSYGVGCSVAMLFLMLLFVFLSIIAFRWKMTKGMGVVMLLLYVVFVVISLLLIYNTISCPI